MTDIILRPWRTRDHDAFRALNEAWIQKLFALEDKDREILNDPEKYILAAGGRILIAERNEEIAACCALIPVSDGFELAKMTVAENFRGRGIGRNILKYAIEVARECGARRLFLETNSSLLEAMHLYEAMGFVRIPPGQTPPSPYARSDVSMELRLTQGS